MVVSALAIGWLGATVTQSPAPQQTRASSAARPQPPEPSSVPRAEKLRERMIQPPQPGRGRNPFVYSVRSAPLQRDHQEHGNERIAAAAPSASSEPVAAPLPIFRLSGIASDTKDGKMILTAILMDNGSMVFAKTGDKLSNGYSVVKVEETLVTLVDASGVTQTIRLP